MFISLASSRRLSFPKPIVGNYDVKAIILAGCSSSMSEMLVTIDPIEAVRMTYYLAASASERITSLLFYSFSMR